ncbi:Cloroperoxidase [Obba rivulosa]|uniref:Cloroperoxidase n=1 Tax=Obba rivulosa TaxID=1052685 RepID=A0A8E2AV58_9APHY|nr:Cloroperoxidase [Obba rivulosa]
MSKQTSVVSRNYLLDAINSMSPPRASQPYSRSHPPLSIQVVVNMIRLFLILPFASLSCALPGLSWIQLSNGFMEQRIKQAFRARQGPVAIVDGLTQIPDADHPFMAPEPTDQRGPCPGLNVLANHGYLPHSGIVTQADVVSAVSEGFNMGADLSELLSVLAVAQDGDLITGKFSIGGPDSRAALLGSLQNILGVESSLYHRSNGVEADASATRDDAYSGDDHTMIPGLYAQMKSIAANYGGLYTLEAMKDVQQLRHQQSVQTNPTFHFVPITGVLVIGAKAFISEFFSNGTYGDGGVPNEESISSFFGAQLLPNGSYEFIPERFPDNWYRRGTPFGLVNAIDEILDFYLTRDIGFGANAGAVNSFVPLDLGAITNVNSLAASFRTHCRPTSRARYSSRLKSSSRSIRRWST